MRKLLVGLLALGLLSGCTKYQNGKPVSEPKQESPVKEVKKEKYESGKLKEALKQFKNGKVEDVTDARKTTGHITVNIKLDDNYGTRSQVGGIITNTDNFIKALKDKPKTVSVMVFNGNMKVLQFTKEVETKKLTLDMAHPDIEDYLKKAGYIGE